MSVSTGARLLELLLALRRRLSVPILRIDIIGDDPVAEGLHRGQDRSTSFQVGRSHVGGLHTNDVDESSLKLRHLGGKSRSRERADVWVCPRVRGDLVASLVRGLDSSLLVVDAALCRSVCFLIMFTPN